MKPALTLERLKSSVKPFLTELNRKPIVELFGITDGKAVGTYVEHRFKTYLSDKYTYEAGNSASGIDFPAIEVDLKVTSIKQPQSSCPYRNAEQKVYGLGYHLLVFVYDKKDDAASKSAKLDFLYAIFVTKERTADYQTTLGLKKLLDNNANQDDIVAFIEERNLPLEEVGKMNLAQKILDHPPVVGYLTVSNALQWRLQYGRVIDYSKKETEGVVNLIA